MKIAVIIVGIIIIGGVIYLSSQDNQEPTQTVNSNSQETNEEISTLPEGAGATNTSMENLQMNDFAPDFSLKSFDGTTITLSSYRGEKPVVLDFWASWCPNCRRDMPHLNTLYNKYQGQFEVIGVNLQENASTAQNYVTGAGIDFPIVLDPDREVTNAFGITYTNIHVLINKAGELVKVIPGDIKESDITPLL